MAVRPETRRFTVDEYYRMAEAGILGPEDRVELIDGEIVAMSPIGPPHGSIVDRLNKRLVIAVGDEAIVRIQGAVRLSDFSEPEPDVALLLPHPDAYSTAHPEPNDVLLLIEVSETSLAYDRGPKLSLYARSGIREVWIVDVAGRRVEVHRGAQGDAYRGVSSAGPGDDLSPEALPQLTIAVQDILGS
ncbi:MAG: Uma2 family endonuclease [Actinomycetota bacterium]